MPTFTIEKGIKPATTVVQQAINTIRTLCMDAVQQANSGHPGTPMAMAPVIYTLLQEFLRFAPEDSIWPNRDQTGCGCRTCWCLSLRTLQPGHQSTPTC